MSRIPTPTTIDAAPAPTHDALRTVAAQLGSVPNMFRLIANSPAALHGYLGLSAALGKGRLDARTRERIAVAVAQHNGCSYCLSAHTYLGKNLARLDDAELARNREGRSGDAKAGVAVQLAVALVRERGRVDAGAIERALAAGYDHGQVVEIITHVALNTLTNYINHVADTVVDFPMVDLAVAA